MLHVSCKMVNVITEQRDRNLYPTVITCGLKPGQLAQDYRATTRFTKCEVEAERLREV